MNFVLFASCGLILLIALCYCNDLTRKYYTSENPILVKMEEVSKESAAERVLDIEGNDAPSLIDKETQHRYRVFKKNAPYVYDYLSTNSLLWPSLSVQFFPDLEQNKPQKEGNQDNVKEIEMDLSPASQLAFQRLLLGTFTLGQAVDAISIHQLPYYRNLNKCINIEQWNYSTEKEEFELPTVSKTKLSVSQTINHLGDVNKLKYMPQNPDVIASSNNMGNFLVYNRTKHSTIKTLMGESDINEPQLRLVNQSHPSSTDIFAFDWNRQKEGVTVAGSMDGIISLYDIRMGYGTKLGNDISATWDYLNDVGINDIEWVPTHDSVFLSADDKGGIRLHDSRSDEVTLTYTTQCAVNSVAVNPGNSFCVASGLGDGQIELRDIRLPSEPLRCFTPHSDAITQLKWHPTFHGVLGSSSADRLVKLHDISVESPLLFDHEGHMLGVNDFDWSPNENWMIASVADDNSLHVWKPAEHLVSQYR